MSTFRDIDNLMNHMLEVGPVGCSVAITQGEDTLYENYYGYADAAKTKPLGPDHIYRLYSMTKVVAAICGLIQFERGKFLLTDPLYEYLPEFKNMNVQVQREDGSWDIVPSKQPILMKHTFSMGVGLLAYDGTPTAIELQKAREGIGGLKTCNKYDLQTEARAMAKVPMLWEPGTHWQYGYGLDLMAAVVEVTSGMKLSEFMRKEIFEPLGMNETGYHIIGDMADRLVDDIELDENGKPFALSPARSEDRLLQPDGIYESAGLGLVSTLRDYSKFAMMLANGGRLGDVQIIGRKTIDLMRQNQLNETQLKEFNSDYRAGYGYGLGVRTMMDLSAGSNSSLGEFGWSGYLGNWVSIDPVEKTSIVYMHHIMPNMELYTHHRVRAVANGLFR